MRTASCAGRMYTYPISEETRFECQKSDIRRTHLGCRLFDIRLMADRMSKIRQTCFWCRIFEIRSDGRSNVKNPTSDRRVSDVEYSKFNRTADRMSKIRHCIGRVSDGRVSIFQNRISPKYIFSKNQQFQSVLMSACNVGRQEWCLVSKKRESR